MAVHELTFPITDEAEILKLRQALGAAQRRDTVDAGLRNAEARLAALPAITTGMLTASPNPSNR